MSRTYRAIIMAFILATTFIHPGEVRGQQDAGSAPAVPELLEPAVGASLSPQEGVLDWGDVPDADGYQVQFGTECGEGDKFFASQSRYTVSGLDDDTYYFWRVRARNNKGKWGEFSECRMFSTSPDGPGVPRFPEWRD